MKLRNNTLTLYYIQSVEYGESCFCEKAMLFFFSTWLQINVTETGKVIIRMSSFKKGKSLFMEQKMRPHHVIYVLSSSNTLTSPLPSILSSLALGAFICPTTLYSLASKVHSLVDIPWAFTFRFMDDFSRRTSRVKIFFLLFI